ncbi:MAG: ZIP family metal transporter [Bacteroidota bacterium]
MPPILLILLISLLGPMAGSLLGILGRPSEKSMLQMLSFAAGVMLSISFLELIPESAKLAGGRTWIAIAGIVLGALVMYAVDRLLPHVHPEMCGQEQGRNLQRTALSLIAGISLHNLPEGMAMAIGAVTSARTGLTIALAIAIHDIPEGICTSAPYFHATGRRLRSFLVSAATSVPVVVGFFLARLLYRLISLDFVVMVVGATAGLMIYICADELIPTSRTGNHGTIFFLIAGVVFVMLLGMV